LCQAKTPAANTGFASGGEAYKLGALCCYSSSVLFDSFVLRNPPPSQNPKPSARKKTFHPSHITPINLLHKKGEKPKPLPSTTPHITRINRNQIQLTCLEQIVGLGTNTRFHYLGTSTQHNYPITWLVK